MPEKKLTLEEFGQRVKTKYPEYKDMPDAELATKMLAKYPEYADMVEVKKKEQSGNSTMENGGLGSEKPNQITPTSPLTSFTNALETLPEPTSPLVIKPKPKQLPPLTRPTEQADATNIEKPFVNDLPQRTTKEDLNKSLKSITPKLVNRNEEYVVPQLEYEFGGHGFKFEETGFGTNKIKVTAPNGKEQVFSLDSWGVSESARKNVSAGMQAFIKDNARDYDKYAKIQRNYDVYNKKLLDQKEVNEALATLDKDTRKLSQETKLGLDRLKTLIPGTPEYNEVANNLEKQQIQYEKNKKSLDLNVGRYVTMKASQGTYLGGVYNSILEGTGELMSGITGIVIDTASPGGMSLPDATKKALKQEALPKIREVLVKNIGDVNTSKEWTENAGFVHSAILGLAKSLPAMAGGGSGMLPLMYAQVSDNLDKQMSENPEFDNVSEEEKLLVKVPVGIAGAALEKYGFRNVIESKGLLNSLVLKAIGASTSKTTAKSFNELIEKEIESEIAKGVLRIGAGGLAEFETGAAQEVVDISAKQIYNAVKEKNMFETPESTGAYLKQVFEAGAQEAIGGGLLAIIPAISKAYTKRNFKDLPTSTIEAANIIGNDPQMLAAVENDVQIKVNTGAITPEEGEDQVSAVRNTIGLLNNLPDNLTAEQQKEALPLVQKLIDLEDEKERAGKVKGIVEPIQLKIDAINEKLTAIIKKPKPKDPPTPPATGGSIAEVEETDLQKFVKEHPLVTDHIKSYESFMRGDVAQKTEEEIEWAISKIKQIKEDPVKWVDEEIEYLQGSIKYREENPTEYTEEFNKIEQKQIQELENLKKYIQNETQKTESKETKTEAKTEPDTNEQAKGEKDEVVETPKEGVKKVTGKFYRSETGFIQVKGTTAADVLNFEADENGNQDAIEAREEMKRLGIDLTKVPHQDIVWVTKSKKAAKRYGNEIGEYDIKDGIVVIPDDGDGGMLIIKSSTKQSPKLVQPKPAPKKSPTKSPETKNLETELLEAKAEVSMLNGQLKAKAAELAKITNEDQSNLFGDRKSDKGKLISQRVNPDRVSKIIKDLKAKRDAAIENVRSLQEKVDRANKQDTGTGDIFESKPEKTPKKPSQKKPGIVENLRKKYGKLDQINQRTLVLRFFATGGRVSLKEAIARTGVKAKDLFGTTAKNGISYHTLYENVTGELGLELGDIDQGDFDNMVDAMLMGPKSDIYKEINSHLEPENKQDAKDPNDPANWTYEDLQIALRNVDPMYHDYIIEKINEFEQSFSRELFEQEKAEIDKILLENTNNGIIEWESVSTSTQQLIIDQNETNNIPTTETKSDSKGDSSDISSKEDGRESQVTEPPSEFKKTEQLQLSFLSLSGNKDYPVKEEKKTKTPKDNNTRSIIGVWNKFKHIKFFGTTQVKNAADVAHIMRSLENKRIEHSFAVHVDKNGNSHIQFLGIGDITGVSLDSKIILAGVSKFNTKKVYLVHNHPSGNLVPSAPDKQITELYRKGLSPLGITVEHVIMDTYSNEYTHIDYQGDINSYERDKSLPEGQELEVSIMDDQKVLKSIISKVLNSKDVAEAIQQLKFTAMPKHGALILNQRNEIIGNYFYKKDIELRQTIDFVAESGIGVSVIMYGNQLPNDTVRDISSQLEPLGVKMLDYIVVNSNGEGVIGYYESMSDMGVLDETQEKYGTSVVKERSTKFTTQNKVLAKKIRSKKISGLGIHLDLGISKVIYNGALEIAAREVEKGTKLGKAIAKAIAWVDTKVKTKWDKKLFAAHLADKFKVNLNNREVEVKVDNSQVTAELINGFYSPLENGINNAKYDKATGEVWLKRLRGETEGEELKWTGTEKYLTDNFKTELSKKDLLDFFKDNRIEIAEVVKGAPKDKNGNTIKYYQVVDEGGFDVIGQYLTEEQAREVIDENPEWTMEEADFDDPDAEPIGDEPRYLGERYNLSGPKDDYKEILILLPRKKVKADLLTFEEWYNEEFKSGRSIVPLEELSANARTLLTKRHQQEKESNEEYAEAIKFQSTHWEEPNVIVHLRSNIREDSEGNKIYFIEEIQSDWGQIGREKGFDNPGLSEKEIQEKIEINTRVNVSQGEYTKLLNLAEYIRGTEYTPNQISELSKMSYNDRVKLVKKKHALKLKTFNDRTLRGDANQGFVDNLIEVEKRNYARQIEVNAKAELDFEQHKQDIDRWHELTKEQTKPLIHKAPFVTELSSYTKLGIKLALKEAVKAGADKIAWTTGEQQNIRNSLSSQVDELSYVKNSNGTYHLIGKKGDRPIVDQKGIEDSKLADYVGKDVAQKIRENIGEETVELVGDKMLPFKSLTGKNLEVGGKGMRRIYGSMKDNEAGLIGDIFKSLTGQEIGKIKLGDAVTYLSAKEALVEFEKGREVYVERTDGGEYLVEEEKEIEEAENNGSSLFIEKSSQSTQFSIEITPPIVESVKSGIPLFKGLTPNEQIRRGIQKLKAIPNKGIARDITSLPAEVIEALADIAIGYARRGGDAMGEYIKFLRSKYKDYLKNVTDKELETLYKKANGIKEERKPGQVKKTIATIRAYEGDIREGVKKAIESLGLYRERESWADAKARAQEFVKQVGYDNALEAVRNNDVDGGAGAFVWNEILENVNRQMLTETDPQKLAELEALQGKLFQEFSAKALSKGRFGSALYEIYQNSDLGYNVEKKINDWKEEHGGTITPDMEAKFREIDRELKEIKEKLAKAEERAKEAEKRAMEAEAVAGIKESIEREKKQRVSAKIRQETDRLLKKVQEAKIHRPGMFMTATPASIIWDGAVNAVELSIKAGGRTAEAIAKGVEFIKGSAWYKSHGYITQGQIIKEFEDWWKEKPKAQVVDGKLTIPHSLIRELVAGGIDNIEDLTEAVKQLIEVDTPGVTTREIRDAITDYGKVVNVNKEQIAMEIRKMKRIGRILSGLEDIAEKKRPLRSGMQRDTLDAQERALQKELREAMKELPPDAALEAEQQKTATDALKRRLKNQIEDLEREISKGVQVPRSARTIQMDQEIQDLKDMLAAVKKRHDAVFKNEAYEAAKRLEMAKKRTTARIAELQRRIKEKDFAPKKKVPIIEDTELANLRAEKIRIQNKYDVEFYKDKILNRTAKEKIVDFIWDLWGITRVLRATGEFSFVLIQGLIQTYAHPKNAVEAFKVAWKNFKSESASEKFIYDIKAQTWYPQLKQSKLALTEAHADVTAREELFYSEWSNLIWDTLGLPFLLAGKTTYKRWTMANPVRAIERASVGFLDTMRVLRWLDGKDMLEAKGIKQEDNPQAWKEMADVINTMTGRASLGPAEMIAPQLTKIFFSPRNWASVFKTASPYALIYFGTKRAGAEGWKPSVAQKMALMDYIKFIGLTTSMVAAALVYLNSDDDEETGVETDPTSSDYMKIKIGNKRIDPWGGRQQEVVLTARLIAGMFGKPMKKTDGRMVQIGTPNQSPTMGGLISDRLTNKLAPSAGMFWRYMNTHIDPSGKRIDKWGQDYDFTQELKDNLYPIYWETLSEMMQDDPGALDGLLVFYTFFGGSVNVYKPKQPKERGPRKRPTRPER